MANALCFMMPILPGTSLTALAATLAEYQKPINDALTSIGTVHFARFTLLDRSQPNLLPSTDPNAPSDSLVIAVITEYDGDFNKYIADFVAQLSAPFDALMNHVVGGAATVPVANNLSAFQAFITLNDAAQHLPNQGLYQAYPQTVQQILASV